MSSKSQRNQLPFEPSQKRKKTSNKTSASPQGASSDAKLSAIPEAVSKRMVRRMALFCGIPTALGIITFVLSYWIVSQELFELPTTVVVVVSVGFFCLGFLGLSYGVISASWDENRPGSWWGGEEFTTNFGRMTSAWRSTKREAKGD